MAAHAERTSGDGEVSNCVSNLVHAFTNGLNIFKRLRERRRRRKSKHKHHSNAASEAELQLSNSLRQGPRDIKERYELCYGEKGDRFAKGDSIAHASLAETLIKLNTGLVGIIATFLTCDSKSSHLNLDYKSLTSLSDASRREAVDSLNQLYQRLSQSQLQLHRMASPKADPGEKRRRSSSKQRGSGPTVARVPVKYSSQRQLVMVRPKNTRKGSSSSSSSTKSQSTTATPPYASPLGSPLPQYSPLDPYPPPKAPSPKANYAPGRRRAGSFDGPRPTTWPHDRPYDMAPLQAPPLPPKIPLSRKSPPPREKHASPPPSAGLKRRMDKATPSTYTFASDSTKLGEIPQRNWTVPWNYEEAERLNAEAAVNGYPMPTVADKPKAKKGLFGFLRRGSAQA